MDDETVDSEIDGNLLILHDIMCNNPELNSKLSKLKMLRDVIRENNLTLENKRLNLQEEEHKLLRLQYDIWTTQDSICDDVWTFTKNHDFEAIINNAPNIHTNSLPDCCSLDEEERKKAIISKALMNETVYNLTIKLENLEKELGNKETEMILEEELKKANSLLHTVSEDEEIKVLEMEIERVERCTNLLHKKIDELKSDQNISTLQDDFSCNTMNSQLSFDVSKMESMIDKYSTKYKNGISINGENKSCSNGSENNYSYPKFAISIKEERKIKFTSLQQNFKRTQSIENNCILNYDINNCTGLDTENYIVNETLKDVNLNELFMEDSFGPVKKENNSNFKFKKAIRKSSNNDGSNTFEPKSKKRVKFDLSSLMVKTFDQKEQRTNNGFVFKKQSKISQKLLMKT